MLFIVFGVFTTKDIPTTIVRAATGDNISGYAWSDNIGWVSFNDTSDGSTASYGVTVDDISTSPTYGDFSGYAWSDNIGWISFNRADTGNPPLDEGDDPGVLNGTGIAKVDWTTGKVTGWARALSSMKYDSSVSSNQCPFTDGPGRRVVTFNSGIIRSNKTESAAKINVIASIPAGTYDITLVSYDGNKDSQLEEQWYLKFNSETISMSNPSDVIADRPDFSDQVFQIVQVDYPITTDIIDITAYHAAYGTPTALDSANSIEPVCAVFDEPNRWDGWIKLGGTTGPNQWTNEVTLDVTYGSPTENQFSGYAWGSEVVGWLKFDSQPGFGVTYGNAPPSNPEITPTSPVNGLTGSNKTFVVNSTDINGDNLKYGVDWNKDNVIDEWYPLDGSYTTQGADTSISHIWTSPDTYTFQVLAEDEKGAQSGWTSYTAVTIKDPECNNGIDDDADGWTDYDPDLNLRDPGCSSFLDDNENDNPECSDGIDNADQDGYCDFAGATCVGISGDPSCNDKFGTDEGAPICNNNGACDSGESIIGCPQDCFLIKEF